MLGRFYEVIATELKTLTNDAGEAPFEAQPALVAKEAPAEDLAVRPGWPLAVIKFARARLKTGDDLSRYDDTRERSAPVKDGTGSSELVLSGDYYGNANWKATCTAGGTVGQPGILFTLEWRGYDPATAELGDTTSAEGLELALDGTLALDAAEPPVLPDGTTATFGAGTIAAGDEWTWTTRNYRTFTVGQRRAENEFHVELYFTERIEHLTDAGGWLDKLLAAFLAREVQADGQVFTQDLKDVALDVLADESGALEAFKYTFELELGGLIYRTHAEPLLGRVKWQ
jgi:hypothetical protein